MHAPFHVRSWAVECVHRAIAARLVTRLQVATATGVTEDRLRALLFDGAEPTEAERQLLRVWTDRLEAGDRTARGLFLA